MKPKGMKNTRMSALKKTPSALKSISIYQVAILILAHSHLFGVDEQRLTVLRYFMAFLGALFDCTLMVNKYDDLFAKLHRFTDLVDSDTFPELKAEFHNKFNYVSLAGILEKDVILIAGQQNCVGLMFEHVNHV